MLTEANIWSNIWVSKRLETQGGEADARAALLLLLWPEEQQGGEDDGERPVTSVMQRMCVCVPVCVYE